MSAAADVTHIARQPILDARGHVFGYELLYRGAQDATSCSDPAANVTARIISDVLTGPGFDALTGGARAFVNLDGESLLADAAGVIDPEQVVLEILETVPVTPRAVELCASLHQRGYTLALDDFVAGSDAEVLVAYARFVKVDVLATPAEQLTDLVRRLLGCGVTVIAEKVESAASYAKAAAAGCSLFQGYHFARPERVAVRSMAAGEVTQLQLFAALMRPTVSIVDVEELLKRDTALSYRVLRTVNSAGFGLRREIGSIREALLMLGLDQVRKWASLWTLASLNKGPSELLTMTIVRARTCETVGQALGRAEQGYFLLGMCSLLDALLGQPMDKVVAELPVPAEIRGALLGEANPARQLLDAVVRYERAEWLEASSAAAAIGLDEDTLPEAYLDALAWARAVTQAAGNAA